MLIKPLTEAFDKDMLPVVTAKDGLILGWWDMWLVQEEGDFGGSGGFGGNLQSASQFDYPLRRVN